MSNCSEFTYSYGKLKLLEIEIGGMNVSKRTAMVVGASGLTGSHLVKYLCDHEAYDKVIIIVRQTSSFRHAKLVSKVKNLNEVSKHDFEGVHDFFCCLGTTMKKAGSKEAFEQVDLRAPIQLGKLAQSQDVQHMLVISAMGANPKSSIYYNRVKGMMEDKVAELPLPHVSIFRPSLLTGERKEFRVGERFGEMVMNALKPVLIGPLKKYRSIEANQVAFAMMQKAVDQPISKITVCESAEMAQVK